MNDCHEKSKHTYQSVRTPGNRPDFNEFPPQFKPYDESLPKVSLNESDRWHRCVLYSAMVTATKRYPPITYYLRTVPSAGALYPCELYFQARGVDSIPDGVYHFDPLNKEAVKIADIHRESGIETYLEDRRKIEGLIFLITSIYERSRWKYGRRAFRYALLDAGHMCGSIEYAAMYNEMASRVLFKFDKQGIVKTINPYPTELPISMVLAGIPKKSLVKHEPTPLTDPNVEKAQESDFIKECFKEYTSLSGCKKSLRYTKQRLLSHKLKESILNRRSCRKFDPSPLKKEFFKNVVEAMSQPIISDCDEDIEIYSILYNVENLEAGIYRDLLPIKQGDFKNVASYLALEQHMVKEAAALIFLVSKGKNYIPIMHKAGHMGHRCYITSEYLGLGCCGIGAFYDDEVGAFLDLDRELMVLYALTIGNRGPS